MLWRRTTRWPRRLTSCLTLEPALRSRRRNARRIGESQCLQQKKAYYLDKQTERKMECDKGVDPVWFYSMMRRERMRDRQEQYRAERDQQFLFKDLNSITEMLSKWSCSALRILFDDISLCNYRVIFKISLRYRYCIFF